MSGWDTPIILHPQVWEKFKAEGYDMTQFALSEPLPTIFKQKVLHTFPPNFKKLLMVFPHIKGRQGILYSFGDKLYNPTGNPIPPELLAHEAVHGERQPDPWYWWRLYIEMPDFRLQEELRAHRAEFDEFQKHHPLKEHAQYKHMLANRLASPLYGGMITYEQAYKELFQ